MTKSKPFSFSKKEETMRNFYYVIFVVLITFGMLVAQEVTFTAVPNNMGIQNVTTGRFGCAWGDYDGDGDLDLFISANPHALYRNDGDTLINVIEQAAIVDTIGGYPTGAVWCDIDNDYDLDLISMNSGVKIFQNDGGVFSNITSESGLSELDSGVQLWQCTVGDYDKDGDLDIAYSGYDQGVTTHPDVYARLLNNDGGVFTNVAEDILGWQIEVEAWNPFFVDYDSDNDLDLWLPAIRSPLETSLLLRNEASIFVLVSDGLEIESNAAIASSWGDYDNDGDMDLFIITWTGGNTGEGDMLYRNDGDIFTDVAPDLGLAGPGGFSRGLCWGDYDNDGDLDLLIGANGGTQVLYRNDGSGADREFVDVSEATGVGVEGTYRTATFVDYDNDGFLDIYFNELEKLLMHNEGNSNHWLVIKPRGTVSNHDGIGARVRLVTGDLSQVRQIEGGGNGGMTAGYPWAHFGLGSAAVVDSLIVTWPMGTVDVETNVEADRFITFEEGTGIIVDVQTKPQQQPSNFVLQQNYPNPFNPSTTISFHVPKKSDIRLILYDILGNVVQEIAAGEFAAGRHDILFDADHLATGLYFYKLSTDGFAEVKKMAVVK
ncbi:T9SS C-terminal target domain-containing protein [candidate division KSB1 bacterium]|nr:MAG: T9SS C-terminal target domain-containing protein [candidate division KSB1 bacterium]